MIAGIILAAPLPVLALLLLVASSLLDGFERSPFIVLAALLVAGSIASTVLLIRRLARRKGSSPRLTFIDWLTLLYTASFSLGLLGFAYLFLLSGPGLAPPLGATLSNVVFGLFLGPFLFALPTIFVHHAIYFGRRFLGRAGR